MLEIRTPAFPESVQEGTLLSWKVPHGGQAKSGELLVEIETDKIVLEVFAEESGELSYTKQEGSVVLSEEVLGTIDPSKASVPSESKPESAPEAKPAPADSKPATPQAKEQSKEQAEPSQDHGAMSPSETSAIEASGPAARKISRELGVSLRAGGASEAIAVPEKREKMGRLRQTVANRLVEARNIAAILTTFNKVDLTEVTRIRKTYQEDFEKRHGIRLGFMSFFVKAATTALQKYPKVNAFIEGDEVVYHNYQNIGIAVASDRGLVVPVLDHAETLGFAEVESGIKKLAGLAKNNALTMDHLMGATFTITNGGVFGSLLSTPILTPPQSAILGMHSIEQTPVVKNGEIVVAPVMYLALSYDHRLLDGKDAVLFLSEIKSLIESPERLLFDL